MSIKIDTTIFIARLLGRGSFIQVRLNRNIYTRLRIFDEPLKASFKKQLTYKFNIRSFSKHKTYNFRFAISLLMIYKLPHHSFSVICLILILKIIDTD